VNRRVSGVGLILLALTVLFFLRVAGQALVAFLGVSWLPAMEKWYSGLLPYPVLFPTQIAILMIQGVIDVAVWRGHPVFATPRPRVACVLRRLSYLYALAMVARFAITRSHPIPIVFHWILAAYLFTLARALSAGRTLPSVAQWSARRGWRGSGPPADPQRRTDRRATCRRRSG
jgi:hypothetical protein